MGSNQLCNAVSEHDSNASPSGGKAILKLGFGVFGVGEAGEQGRARLRDRFG